MANTADFWADLPAALVLSDYVHSERIIPLVHKIVVKGGVDIFVRRMDSPTLIVSCSSQGALDAVETRVKDGKLVIKRINSPEFAPNLGGLTQKSTGNNNIQIGFAAGDVEITRINPSEFAPNLGGLTQKNTGNNNIQIGFAAGGVEINGVNVTADFEFTKGRVVVGIGLPEIAELSLKGSGDITLLDLSQDRLSVEIQGSSDVTASGQVNTTRGVISGSGDLDLEALICNKASLVIEGSGDIRAHVSQDVFASIAGSGDIVISGNPPTRKTSVTGSGRVAFK